MKKLMTSTEQKFPSHFSLPGRDKTYCIEWIGKLKRSPKQPETGEGGNKSRGIMVMKPWKKKEHLSFSLLAEERIHGKN